MKIRCFLSKIVLLAAVGSFFAPHSALAQQDGFPEGMEPRKAIGGILMAGLVGGILGLSTLSFYERPQDNIRNITIGAGLGMIAAALYMTYDVSQVPPPKAWNEKSSSPYWVAQSQNPTWTVLPDYNPSTQQASVGFVLNY